MGESGCTKPTPEDELQHAIELIAAVRYHEAIAMLHEIRDNTPPTTKARALLLLGQVARRRGLSDEAIQAFSAVASAAPGERPLAARAALLTAETHAWSRREDASRKAFELVINQFSDVPSAVTEAKLALASREVEEGRCDDVHDVLEEIASMTSEELRTSAAWAQINLASCAVNRRDHKGAVLLLLEVKRRWPEMDDAVRWAGSMLVQLYSAQPELLAPFIPSEAAFAVGAAGGWDNPAMWSSP